MIWQKEPQQDEDDVGFAVYLTVPDEDEDDKND